MVYFHNTTRWRERVTHRPEDCLQEAFRDRIKTTDRIFPLQTSQLEEAGYPGIKGQVQGQANLNLEVPR